MTFNKIGTTIILLLLTITSYSQLQKPVKEVEFKLDETYDSHFWSIKNGFICHAQYSPREIHLTLFNNNLDLANDTRIQVPIGYEKRNEVFVDSVFICWYKNGNEYWVLKYNPFDDSKHIIKGSTANNRVLDNITLTSACALVVERNNIGSIYWSFIHSFDQNGAEKEKYKGRPSFFYSTNKEYIIITQKTIRQLGENYAEKYFTDFNLGDTIGEIRDQSIIQHEGKLHYIALSLYPKSKSRSSWNILYAQIENGAISELKVFKITDFDSFFEVYSDKKLREISVRDQKKLKGKIYQHDFQLLLNSVRIINDKLTIIVDAAEPIEEWEEAFGIEDKDRLVITGYSYPFSLTIALDENKINCEYFDNRSKEMSDPLAGTLGDIIFGSDGDPYLPYSKKLKTNSILVQTEINPAIISYRNSYITQKSIKNNTYSYYRIDNLFDLKNRETIRNEYLYHLQDNYLLLVSLKKNKQDYFMVLRKFKLEY